MEAAKQSTTIGIRTSTRPKLDMICNRMRWTVAALIEAMADKWIRDYSIRPGEQPGYPPMVAPVEQTDGNDSQ